MPIIPKKKISADYNNAKIYQIVNDFDDMLYIGSTTQTLSGRYSVHRSRGKLLNHSFNSALYDSMQAHGLEHFRILLIEAFPCKSKDELEAREYALMATFKKENMYNVITARKHTAEMNAKQSALCKIIAKSGRENGFFARGSIAVLSDRYRFRWYINREQFSRSFSFSAKGRTQAMAAVECRAFQNEIYPLTYEEYAKELPFFSED
jgi:hypothetical protein